MLILPEILVEHKFNPQGVIHIGGHRGEEQDYYDSIAVQNTVWIEALPELVSHLREKFKNRKDIEVYQAAISDTMEKVTFHVTNNLASSSIYDLGTHTRHHPHIYVVDEFDIITCRLDSLGLSNQYDCLNLDIQGAELNALKGADLTHINWIYCEVSLEEVYQGCPLKIDIDEYLDKQGFECIETHITKYNWGDALYRRK